MDWFVLADTPGALPRTPGYLETENRQAGRYGEALSYLFSVQKYPRGVWGADGPPGLRPGATARGCAVQKTALTAPPGSETLSSFGHLPLSEAAIFLTLRQIAGRRAQ